MTGKNAIKWTQWSILHIFIAHAQNGHLSTSGLKSDVTIVFLHPNSIRDAKILVNRVHSRHGADNHTVQSHLFQSNNSPLLTSIFLINCLAVMVSPLFFMLGPIESAAVIVSGSSGVATTSQLQLLLC